jgi:triosephosphate isomerase
MRSLVIGNWKMNPASFSEAKSLFEATRQTVERVKSVNVVVAPSTLYLRELKTAYKGRRIAFAVQNAHAEALGAHTGDISLTQAKDAGASYALIGHAERRALGETNDDTRKKVAATLALKMTPVLCVGESKRTVSGEHYGVVKEQVRAGFADVPPAQAARVIVVYEPLWTIGGDTTMSPRDMHEMAIFIRKAIVDLHGASGMNIKILYGGSVDETNAGAMIADGDVDGLLVGRASIDAAKFASLLSAIDRVS